jgi:hypothetical protein
MKIFLSFFLVLISAISLAQELYVFTEPASNMAAKSIGVRLGYNRYKMNHLNRFSTFRFNPEIMVGVSKKIMVHINGYASNMFQNKVNMEGGSVYGKYRFYSQDGIHSHFRMAAYGKIAMIDNPTVLNYTVKHEVPDGNGGVIIHDLINTVVNNEIDLAGTNSGITAGIIATKLVNKFAVSASLGYLYRLDNMHTRREVIVPWNAASYSFSCGYLILPKEYTSYKQTNVNLYTEILGSNAWKNKTYFFDIAPSVQFIINSIGRIDIGYRTQLTGNTTRMAKSSFEVRLEYNFLNVF